MSVKSNKWWSMDYILNNLTGEQQIDALERKQRYYCEDRGERRMKDKLHTANNFMNRLKMSGTMRVEVEHLITDDFKNLKTLLKNSNQEKIIGLICFFVMKTYNSRARLENYKVFNELKLNDRIYGNFVTNLYIAKYKK